MTRHVHSFDGQWPFAEPENTLAFCCEHVFLRERPILRVSHDHDGDWQFLCGDDHSGAKPRLICMGCALDRDRTLLLVADLAVGWGAEREEAGARWTREANQAPDDDEPTDT